MKKLVALCVAMWMISCSSPSADDKEELMRLHNTQREAHFSGKAQVMVDLFTDNFISINHGKTDTVLSREEDRGRFQQYFDAVKFVKWDDITPPTIRFSEDHTLAYMTIDKLVVLETKDSTGKAIEETTHYAWVSIFRKQKSGEWKIECVASTNEPETVKPL